MAVKIYSKHQVEVGDIVELRTGLYRSRKFGIGKVIGTNSRGSVVEVLESDYRLINAGDIVRFNLNTWNDAINLDERGKTRGTGITAIKSLTDV